MLGGILGRRKTTIIKSKNIAWQDDEATEIVRHVFKEGIIKSGDRTLDIGCGFGRNSNWLATMGADVTAININDDEIKQARLRAEEIGVEVKYIYADATSLPFGDDSFDVCLDLGCSHMIPTREGQKRAEEEAARVLKKGGYLIYFGFSKKHPSYLKNEEKAQFRSLEDIEEIYGSEFKILFHEEVRWEPKSEEHANFKEHVGINIVMQRKQ